MDYIFDILCEAEAETQLLDQFLLQYVRFACTYDRAHDLRRIVNTSSPNFLALCRSKKITVSPNMTRCFRFPWI